MLAPPYYSQRTVFAFLGAFFICADVLRPLNLVPSLTLPTSTSLLFCVVEVWIKCSMRIVLKT